MKKKRPPHPGEVERIAARRVKALELRKAGGSYRAIAASLDCDVTTAWKDVQAELAALKQLSRDEAEDVRAIELQRLDQWMVGLNRGAQQGDPRAVTALVRIAERRAKLLGLDAAARVAIEMPAPLVIDAVEGPSDAPK